MIAAQCDLLKELFCSGALSIAGQAFLSKASQHDMRILHLTHAALTDEICRAMTAAPWTLLEELDLSFNILSQDAIRILHGRPWPKLQQLDLSGNDEMCGLSFLVLAHKKDSIDRFPVLRALRLPGAQGGQISAAPVLQEASWPQLKSLTLTTGTIVSLDSIEITHLVKVGLSSLEKLDLTRYWLDDAGASQLSKGKWPKLRQLKASGAARDLLPHIVHGKWPLLEALDIVGCSLDYFAMRELIKGGWPLLQHQRASSDLPFMAAHCSTDMPCDPGMLIAPGSVFSTDFTLDRIPPVLHKRWPTLKEVVLNWCEDL